MKIRWNRFLYLHSLTQIGCNDFHGHVDAWRGEDKIDGFRRVVDEFLSVPGAGELPAGAGSDWNDSDWYCKSGHTWLKNIYLLLSFIYHSLFIYYYYLLKLDITGTPVTGAGIFFTGAAIDILLLQKCVFFTFRENKLTIF